jgi:hypothetical protein
MMFEKERWEGFKTFCDALKVPLVLFAVLVLIIWPGVVPYIVDRAGYKIESADIAGLKLVAKSASAELGSTAERLARVTEDLKARNDLLRQAAQKVNDPQLRQQINDMIATDQSDVENAQVAANSATAIAADVQRQLQAIAPSGTSSGVPGTALVVFGADKAEEAALTEMQAASNAISDAGGMPGLFLKGGYYRSAAIFAGQAAQDDAASKIQSAVGRKVEKVLVDSWCPVNKWLRNTTVRAGAQPIPIYQCLVSLSQ